MTKIMLIVTAALLAGSLACSKEPAAAPAKSASGTSGASGAVAGTPAAAPATAAMAKPINANCPIGGEPIEADGGTATFKGQTIGFCCPKCAPKFNELDDAGKIAALEKNGTKLPQ